jgi:hypothetical protein
MTIYSTLQIGEFHLNHCEDYLIIEDPGKNRKLLAVMDGCTMGRDSYFISTLTGKILKKICKASNYKELYTAPLNLEDSLKSIIAELFIELRKVQQQLLLEQKDLLTTLIILLADTKLNTGIILAIGDGLVNVNGEITEFDQDNKPDYLGFHLNEDFEKWYGSLTQKILFTGITDISIATDGIGMFKPFRHTDTEIDPIQFLVQDTTGIESEEMLELKLKKLEHVYGYRPTDDIAIIRIIN